MVFGSEIPGFIPGAADYNHAVMIEAAGAGTVGVIATGGALAIAPAAGTEGLSLLASDGYLTLPNAEHAVEQLAFRRISMEELQTAVRTKAFPHFHDGAAKIGYFDRSSRLFVGSVERRITTVFRTTENYIRNLMKAEGP